jgi:hypothetical protein
MARAKKPAKKVVRRRAKKPVEKVLRKGAKKLDPFTIVIVANPVLETPWKSGTFVVDPMTSNRPAFNACAQYIRDALFGTLPSQRTAGSRYLQTWLGTA